MKRSTHCARQVCSFLSSALLLPEEEERKKPLVVLPEVVVEVMHFFQQIAVSSWVSDADKGVSFVVVDSGEG